MPAADSLIHDREGSTMQLRRGGEVKMYGFGIAIGDGSISASSFSGPSFPYDECILLACEIRPNRCDYIVG